MPCSIVSKIESQYPINAIMVAKQEHHKNKMSRGVNIKLAMGAMIDIGMPQHIKIGSDMSVIINCNSKKFTMYCDTTVLMRDQERSSHERYG